MTRKQREESAAERISSKYDIQTAALTGGCRIEMRGRYSLAVGGCRGIIEYSPEYISLRMREDVLNVTGKRLTCDSYTCGEVQISGQVDGLCFAASNLKNSKNPKEIKK